MSGDRERARARSTASSRPASSGCRGRSPTGTRGRRRPRRVSPAGRASVPARPAAAVRRRPLRRSTGARAGAQGDEVAGTRPYRPGDRRTWIDWRASARLSAARGTDEFVVREFFADTAPRVVVVVDRRPGMALYGAAVPVARQGRGDRRRGVDADRPRATAAERRRPRLRRAARPARRSGSRRAPPRTCSTGVAARGDGRGVTAATAARSTRCLDVARPARLELPRRHLRLRPLRLRRRRSRQSMWRTLRALRWDVTPVVVQDPIWEQSFPDVGGVLLPVRDPATGEVARRVVERSRGARARARATRSGSEATARRLPPARLRPGRARQQRAGRRSPRCFDRWADRRRRLRRRSA